jgi:methionyl aminopeptidase
MRAPTSERPAVSGGLKSNDDCWCGSGRKYKRCHKPLEGRVLPHLVTPYEPFPPHIPAPPYVAAGKVVRRPEPPVKSSDVIERMRVAGKVAAEILALAGEMVQPGTTTEEIDRSVRELFLERGAYPSPLTYGNPPFPKSVCTSVNEVICHGIPDARPLQDGDICNLDVTAYVNGVHGDTNATFFAGTPDPESEMLVRVTHECMWKGIEAVRPGKPINVIGRAIEDHARRHKLGVVRMFIGHGIGEQFHTDVQIPHFFDRNATLIMRPGMTFTIEPMISLGAIKANIWPDGWTAVTTDGRRTAQFEHTILVTDDGAEVLTMHDSRPRPAW